MLLALRDNFSRVLRTVLPSAGCRIPPALRDNSSEVLRAGWPSVKSHPVAVLLPYVDHGHHKALRIVLLKEVAGFVLLSDIQGVGIVVARK